MNLIRRGFLLFSVPALFACGCNFFANPCASVTCEQGEVCVNGTCVECNGDEDCAAGESCINGACLADCDTNEDCDPGQVCNNGNCESTSECEEDDDCDAGEVCDEATNTCVECDGAVDCNDNDACTADSCAAQACVNAPITCVTAATCPDGCDTACTLGVCTD